MIVATAVTGGAEVLLFDQRGITDDKADSSRPAGPAVAIVSSLTRTEIRSLLAHRRRMGELAQELESVIMWLDFRATRVRAANRRPLHPPVA